jgi:trans-aconitate 2-methyltransferase
MPTWNPNDYETYLDLRTRPSRDLVQRIPISPARILDLGCGPGNSTAVCAQRWPTALIVGLDSSAEMIESARTNQPNGSWLVGDIGEWIRQPIGVEHEIDLIFSSAALQWVEDHARLFPRLMNKLAPGGVFACQMPAYDAVPNQLMRDMAASERWHYWFPNRRAKEWHSHSLDFYYAILAASAKWLDLWATDYLQIMSNVDDIVEWYKSTGLRPYLECIQDSDQRREFLEEYRSRLSPLYPNSEAGGVPFLFRRIFIVAGVA